MKGQQQSLVAGVFFFRDELFGGFVHFVGLG